jgi:hypothetical protein
MDLGPYPVNSVVDYHGSFSHGRYVITGVFPVTPGLFTAPELAAMEREGLSLRDLYPDGACYEIWQQGILRKFGNRMYSVSRVRRGSLTPVTGEPPQEDVQPPLGGYLEGSRKGDDI